MTKHNKRNPPNSDANKEFVIYRRVPRKKLVGHAVGLEAQRRRLREFIQSQGLREIHTHETIH